MNPVTIASNALPVYALIGWVVACLIIAALWLVTAYLGERVFKRITRIYHLTVIGYWLNRLEEEGTHVFQKASNEARAVKDLSPEDIQAQTENTREALALSSRLFLLALKDTTISMADDWQQTSKDKDASIARQILCISLSQDLHEGEIVEQQRRALDDLYGARRSGILDINPNILRKACVLALYGNENLPFEPTDSDA